MKKTSILIAICVIVLTQIVSAQLHTESSSENLRLGRPHPNPIDGPTGQAHTQFISFDDMIGTGNAGTYNSTDHFAVDVYLTFAGYRSSGFSLWLDTTADAAPHIFLTEFALGPTFPDPNPFTHFPLGFTLLQSDGHYTTPNESDLGGLVDDFQPPFTAPGTYLAGHLSVSLSGLPPGTYTLETDAIGGHTSEVTRYDPKNPPNFFDEYLPVATYTITIVPEPSTAVLLILSTISVGVAFCRRAVSKKTAIVGSGDSHRS